MGILKSLSKGFNKAMSSIKAAFTGAKLTDIKNTTAMLMSDAAGVEARPTLRGSNYTKPTHYFTDKEWKARKKRLKMASNSRRANR